MPPAQGRRLEMAFHRSEYLRYISHVGSKKVIYSLPELRMCVCGQWASREPGEQDL